MAIVTKSELLDAIVQKIRSAGVGGLTTAEELRQVVTDIVDSFFGGDDALSATIAALSDIAVKTSGTQNIAGIKTFTDVPKSPGIPVDDDDVVNRAYVSQVADSIIQLISNNIPFDSNRAIKRQITGLEGVNLNKTNITETLEELLYPVKHPLVSALTLPAYEHEYGDNTNVAVSWTVTKTDQNIDSISVGGIPVAATGNTQSGVTNVVKAANADTNISVVVTSQGKTHTATVTSVVKRKLRIGGSAKTGLAGDPILNSDILTLPGYFATSYLFKGSVTVAEGQHLVIAIPSIFGTPTFLLEGLVCNDFNKVWTAQNFTNSFGHTETFNVWVSKNIQPGTLYLEIV